MASYSFDVDALATTSCPCEHAYEAGQVDHYIWIAFLHTDNDDEEYRVANEIERHSWAAFVQWATSVLDWSSIFHCQAFFWHARTRSFITFSTDSVRGRVFSSSCKTFRRGWTFVRLHVTAAQELAAFNFFLKHMRLRTPFDRRGRYAILFRPVRPAPLAYMCSTLVADALHAAGFLRDVPAHTVSPAALHALLMTRHGSEFAFTLETTNPTME